MTKEPSRAGWALVALWLALPLTVHAAPSGALELDAAALAGVPLRLSAGWLYHPGDDASFAAIEEDDSAWLPIDPAMRSGGAPEGWPGVGWFRLHLELAPDLAARPLGLDVELQGATGVYVDGEHVATYGDFGTTAADAIPAAQGEAIHLTLAPGPHVLAVRYASPLIERFQRVGWSGGFIIRLGTSESIARMEIESARRNYGNTALFCGIFLSFAVLHLLLFIFYPSLEENFYFALMCVMAAALVFLLLYKREMADPRFMLFSEPAMNVAVVLLGLFALRFVYGVFYPTLPRGWRLLVGAGLVLCVWTWLEPAATLTYAFLAMLASCLEMIRVVVVAIARHKPGSLIVGTGVLGLGAGFGVGLLSNLGVLPRSTLLGSQVPFFSIVALLLSMSIYLSLTFARTQRELRRQLAEVERLSEEKIARERQARREELERSLLEAEHERKAAELEEARELQLSMLPRKLPEILGLDIAAHMHTATEVGGDYYDFVVEEDGTLTFAVGDATGHGLRAGTMVTAAKSLFQALAPGSDLVETLTRSAAVLKRMNLRRLAMALTLGRYREGSLQVAAAGMPPIHVFRAATARIDRIEVPGMPLGTLAGYPYEGAVIELAAGDAVLLMSDGFPERLDPAGEMLGYERATEAFAGCGARSAQEIVAALRAEGESWAGGLPPDDDVTFVVVKRMI